MQRCAARDEVVYRVYEGVGHLPIGPAIAPDVVEWIADRFEGVPLTDSCDRE